MVHRQFIEGGGNRSAFEEVARAGVGSTCPRLTGAKPPRQTPHPPPSLRIHVVTKGAPIPRGEYVPIADHKVNVLHYAISQPIDAPILPQFAPPRAFSPGKRYMTHRCRMRIRRFDVRLSGELSAIHASIAFRSVCCVSPTDMEES